MAGQEINIPNIEEAKVMQVKQTNALNGLVEDVTKSNAALKQVDQTRVGKLGEASLEYTQSMVELLTKAAEESNKGNADFKRFITALEEVNNASLHLG